MSHERVFYSCGCLRNQCRCLGPHVTRTITYPCPKHTAGALEGRRVCAESVETISGEAIAAGLELFAVGQRLERRRIEADRERLLAEVWD